MPTVISYSAACAPARPRPSLGFPFEEGPLVTRLISLVCAASLAISNVPSAQGVVLEAGDAIAGVGNTVTPVPLVVPADGQWLALVDTDHADGTRDEVVVRAGTPVLREGDPLAFLLPGATLGAFVSLDRLADGALAAVLEVEFVGTTTALYRDGTLLFVEDQPIDSPLLGVGSTLGPLEFVAAAGARTLFVRGIVRNPAVVGPSEDLLLRVDLAADGSLLGHEVVLTEAQFLPALAAPVSALSRLPRGFASNRRGQLLAYVLLLSAGEALLLDGTTVLARSGTPSPVAGRNYLGFTSSVMSLNDLGQHAFTARLDGSTDDFLIVKNGAKFAQEGDVIAGFSASPLRAGSVDPVVLADSGDLFWRAGTSSFADDGFLRNFTPIVQEGVTVVDGRLVLEVESDRQSFAVSRSGRFFLGRVRLAPSASEALVLADFGAVVPVPGCGANPARLTKLAGDARVGLTLELGLDDGPAVGALPALFFSRRSTLDANGCGLAFPFGEVLLSRVDLLGRSVLAPWDGTNPASLAIPIPADPALVDMELFVQGSFRAPGVPPTLSSALRIEVGAP